MADLNRLRLAKAISTMSAEWGITFEQIIAELDHEPDDSAMTRFTLDFLDRCPRGACDAWIHGYPGGAATSDAA